MFEKCNNFNLLCEKKPIYDLLNLLWTVENTELSIRMSEIPTPWLEVEGLLFNRVWIG